MSELPDARESWAARSLEGVHGKNPHLLSIHKLANAKNAGSGGSYARLSRLKVHDSITPSDLWSRAVEFHDSLVQNHPEESTALLMSMRMLVSAAPSAAKVAEVLQTTFQTWLLPAAPGASCYLIEVSERLGYRYAITRAFLSTSEPSEEDVPPTETLFASARGLFSDTTFGLNAYLDCMLSSLSPEVWGFTIPRAGGVVLLTFGAAMSGQSNLPVDKIQLLTPKVSPIERDRATVKLSPDSFNAAARWWVHQLDVIFSLVTEPANNCRAGTYSPSMALETTLTLEQVFRDCQSIATLTRDQHARRTLAFQVLNRLEGLIPQFNWKKAVGLNHVRTTLEEIKRHMPVDLHPIFLPRAENAVNALRDIADGFFWANRRGEAEIRVPDSHGGDQLLPRQSAVTEWLRLIRNSLHGFEKPTSPRQQTLLAAHDGHIPGDFADIAWLHLLSIMARPEKLARFSDCFSK